MTISVIIDGRSPALESNYVENIVKLKSGDTVDFLDDTGRHSVTIGHMTRIDKGARSYELHIFKADGEHHPKPTPRYLDRHSQKNADEFYFEHSGQREAIDDPIAQNLMLATGRGETLTYKNVDYSIYNKQLTLWGSVLWQLVANPV